MFWTVGEVLDFARAIVMDMQIDATGENLSNDKPYVPVLLNLAYDELQDMLEDAGVESVSVKEWFIKGIPASSATDSSAQASLGPTGYFDGVGETQTEWQLPGDLLEPMHVWERQSGAGADFVLMRQHLGGFPARQPMPYYGRWEFRGDHLWFPASTTTNDLRIRGVPSLAELVVPAPGQSGMQIPLARCGSALAYLVAAKYVLPRAGAATASVLQAAAQSQIDRMSNRSAKRAQQSSIRRPAYGGGRWRRR